MSKRTAEDFVPHAIENLRGYIRAFTPPQPPPYPLNDIFILPPVPKGKSHENSALAVSLEDWRTLENIRSLDVADNRIIAWLNEHATTKKLVDQDKARKLKALLASRKSGPRTRSSTATRKASTASTQNASASAQNTTVVTQSQNAAPTTNVSSSQGTNSTQGPNSEEENTDKPPFIGTDLPAKLNDKFYTQKPCDLEDMELWLRVPLVTVARVMHQINEKEFDWTISRGLHNMHDFRLFRYLKFWNIVVAYQTPYVLAEHEMEEFAACRSFPQICNPLKKPSLQSKHRLWAKIWDTCCHTKCHWFILTTYTKWVVGCFSPGWRIGFVSPIFHPKAPGSKLSVLEWLTYWFATAMGMVGTQLPPKIFEPIMHSGDVQMDLSWGEPSVEPSVGIRSESNWEGADEAPEGAAVDELDICSGTGSLNTNGEPRNRPRTGFKKASIRGWVAQAQPTTIRPINEDDIEVERPLDIEAEWPDHILFEAGRVHGEWMIRS